MVQAFSDLAGDTALKTMFHHGGNLKSAQAAFANAPHPWIDLSTGINPVPWPIGTLSAVAWTRLPEAPAIAGLERVAAKAWGAGDPHNIVAAPGTQALIQWLPRLWPAKTVGILGFTYAEHASVWRAAGAEVQTVAQVSALDAFDVAIIVNPNNPDGRLVAVQALAALAAKMAARGGLLVVDEAFADLLPTDASLIPALPLSGAMVMRSFGKTYGLAGLRLGFGVAPALLAQRLREALGPWAVSGAAVEIAGAALADANWLMHSAARLAADGARLDALLARAGFTRMTGTHLFRLGFHPAAAEWFLRLAHAGILVRPFNSHPNMLRFGLPGPDDWARVAAALAGQLR